MNQPQCKLASSLPVEAEVLTDVGKLFWFCARFSKNLEKMGIQKQFPDPPLEPSFKELWKDLKMVADVVCQLVHLDLAVFAFLGAFSPIGRHYLADIGCLSMLKVYDSNFGHIQQEYSADVVIAHAPQANYSDRLESTARELCLPNISELCAAIAASKQYRAPRLHAVQLT